MRRLLPLTILLYSMPAFSWQVSLQEDNSIVVSNQKNLDEVSAYLVWYDKDATEAKERFFSWTYEQDVWQAGITPAMQPITLPPFESLKLTKLPKTCPKDHRCFLALVATPPDQDPVDNNYWSAASLLPLTVVAGQDRLPGQQFFLPATSQGVTEPAPEEAVMDDAEMVDEDRGDTATEGAAPSPSMDATKDSTPANGESAPTTEKPDIFSLVGNKLLFANNQAQRFQVIDLSDPTQPRLTGEIKLTGYPLEVYVMGDYYVLLQTANYSTEAESQFTVIQEAAEGQLSVVQELPLSGQFLESRRRGSFIYSVSVNNTPYYLDCSRGMVCPMIEPTQGLNINVLQMDNGQLTSVDKAELPGYSPVVAIFPDHLVVANHNPEETSWLSTQIQVFDLAQTSDPFVELPAIKVPGQVPSEFHLSIKDQLLRVAYGPADRQDGSTLAVYDLAAAEPKVIGKVDKIAPGEDLFATRFVDNRAFVVTYERTDPLWVIDLTNPAEPTILGELKVPGWSEKMFFHEDRLFAVGYDDQPLPTEGDQWVRRVALSLFNVANPTQPTLINRFTPLAGQVTYSWSPALDDERALLLNWEEAFAALPINSWESEAGSHLQIVSLAADQIDDVGLINMPIDIQRSLSVAPNILAALGDQALLTLQWGTGKPQVLAELELAINIAWLTSQNNKLWAASYGQQGYNRFYQYDPTDLTTAAQRWSLPRSYDNLLTDEEMAVFYNYNPLAVQAITLADGQLQPAHALETRVEGETADYYYWYNRSQPLLHQGKFFVAEQKPLEMPVPMNKDEPMMILPMPEDYYSYMQWNLRTWDLQANPPTEAAVTPIPGEPIAFTSDGKLVTREATNQNQLRLNLVALGSGSATLVSSQEFACDSYSSYFWTEESLYLTCGETYYYPLPVMEEPLILEEEKVAAESDFAPMPPTTAKTVILKLDPQQNFAEQGQWTFEGYRYLQNAVGDIVLINKEYGRYYAYDDVANVDVASTDMAIMPPYQSGCDVYRLESQAEPQLLKQLEESCPSKEMSALDEHQLWTAKGFAGISNISW